MDCSFHLPKAAGSDHWDGLIRLLGTGVHYPEPGIPGTPTRASNGEVARRRSPGGGSIASLRGVADRTQHATFLRTVRNCFNSADPVLREPL